MMKSFLKVLLASAACAGVQFTSTAFAADIADPAGCSVMGIVEGGGIYDRQTYVAEFNEGQPRASSNWTGMFGEAAMGLTCDAVNFQIDSAAYRFSNTTELPDVIIGGGGDNRPRFAALPGGPIAAPTLTNISTNFHVGGASFWRDNSKGALGVAGSVIFATTDVSNSFGASESVTDSLLRVGAFGEYFVSDDLTFGGSAHYINGNMPFGFGSSAGISGVELTALAKFYPAENISILGQVDFLSATNKEDIFKSGFTYTGFALSLEGEYKLADNPISILAGGRYGNRKLSFGSPFDSVEDLQAYLGVKFAFGGNANGSLVSRDRSSTYDNSSTIFEKLPNYGSSRMVGSTGINTL